MAGRTFVVRGPNESFYPSDFLPPYPLGSGQAGFFAFGEGTLLPARRRADGNRRRSTARIAEQRQSFLNNAFRAHSSGASYGFGIPNAVGGQ